MESTEQQTQLDNPVTKTPDGTFRGSILTSFCGLPFAAYRGIPFALPPVGPLRFARPVPHPKLEGIYDATEEGPISIQPTGIHLGPREQEDCLYLNVFTPASNFEKKTVRKEDKTSLKKVMVFIHGGGFFMGCANQHVPGDFVAQGNVIVVTINYRLSWLGFLKDSSNEIRGNMGLWDQVEALKWVKRNIRAFGGDCDDVTISGQSMGGESVSALSIMKQAKNLFTKGIILSGAVFSCKSTPGSSDVLFDILIDKVGLSKEGKSHSQLIEELKNLPIEKFILPLQDELAYAFTTIDGDMYPASLDEIKQDKDYLTDVGFYNRDYLVSLTNNEGQYVAGGPFSPIVGKGNGKILDTLQISETLYHKQFTWYSQPGHHVIAPLNDLFADYCTMLPTFEFLKTAADSPSKSRSYFLWFDLRPSYVPHRPDAAGSVHGLDLCYLFDMEPDEIYKTYNGLRTKKGFTEEDKELKKIYIDLMVDFMHHGNTNKSLASHLVGTLPPYESKNQYFLNFGPKLTIEQYPLKERREMFETLVPQWKREETLSS